jgi:hypothetical protein
VRHYLDAVQPFEDGERIRWVGTVGGPARTSWSAGTMAEGYLRLYRGVLARTGA